MANRMFNQFQGALEKSVVDLFAQVAFGASGAASLTRGKGIASIAKIGTGLYNIVLQDSYVALLGVAATYRGTTAPTGVLWVVNTDNSATSAPAIVMQCYDEAGVATEPASGENLFLSFTFCNSTAL